MTSVQGSGSTFTVDLPFGKIKESGKPTRFSDINGRNDLAKVVMLLIMTSKVNGSYWLRTMSLTGR